MLDVNIYLKPCFRLNHVPPKVIFEKLAGVMDRYEGVLFEVDHYVGNFLILNTGRNIKRNARS